jgi:hypothetical protein
MMRRRAIVGVGKELEVDLALEARRAMDYDDHAVPAVDTQTEGEDDLDKTSLQHLKEAVVSGSDWTTETILRQLERGNIILNPEFQRRDAWRGPRKSRFIESLILGLPIPQLVLAENKNKRGTFIVIDGKQRLLSIRQFAAQKDDGVYPQLRLEGLEVRKDLNGKSMEEMRTAAGFDDDLTQFDNQTIRTVVIKNWPNESVLYLIFLRLNTGSVQLSPQELRRALHPGPFVSFADEFSAGIVGFQRILKTMKPDFRMRDVELLVRYYAFKNFLPDYKGNLKEFLDHTCEELNQAWDDRQDAIRHQGEELAAAIDTTYNVFQENAFRKWDGREYEHRFNRAIFDVMTFYFSQPKVRRAAHTARAAVQKDFQRLCASNDDFRTAIEVTTKSVPATATRLRLWGEMLNRRLHLNISVPELVGRRMTI